MTRLACGCARPLLAAIAHFGSPLRPSLSRASRLAGSELRTIAVPTTFVWGTEAPYLSVDQAEPSIEQIPGATLHKVPGGHGPWLVDTERSAKLIHTHLTTRSENHS